jgi:excisionase family DNA binding protein
MRNAHQPEDGTHGSSQAPSLQKAANRTHATIPFAQRLTCTIAEACEATGLGRTKLYELIGAGCLDTTTIGRRRLVLVRSLRMLLDEEDAQSPTRMGALR